LSDDVKWYKLTLDSAWCKIYIVNMENELLTINQLAEFLQVSRATIYEYIADPKHPLPVFYLSDRTPRFKKADIEKWLADKQVDQTKPQYSNPMFDDVLEKVKGGEQ